MKDRVQALARRAAGGDLAAAKRLVRLLEGRSDAPKDDFDLAEQILEEWYREEVRRVAAEVVERFDADPHGDPFLEFVDLVSEVQVFTTVDGDSLALYGFAHSTRGKEILRRGLGRPVGFSGHVIRHQFVFGVFAFDVLDWVRFDPALRQDMVQRGYDIDSWGRDL